jgi:hypothetical protein
MGTSILGRSSRKSVVQVPAAERVAVDQHGGLAGAVIFVVDLDAGVVLLADGDCGHGFPSAVGDFGARRRPV